MTKDETLKILENHNLGRRNQVVNLDHLVMAVEQALREKNSY